MMIGLLTLVVLSIGLSSPLTHALLGCSWSGSMGGPGGEATCPSPKVKEKCPLTPSYDQVNNLWACPSYDKTSGGKYYAQCTKGTGPNPLCASDNKCCCPKDGCWTPPFFNWIIAACKGSGCGGYVNNEATQEFKDMGTNLSLTTLQLTSGIARQRNGTFCPTRLSTRTALVPQWMS